MQQWEYCSLVSYQVKGQKEPSFSWFLLMPDGKEANMGPWYTKDQDSKMTIVQIFNRIGADGWELVMGILAGSMNSGSLLLISL